MRQSTKRARTWTRFKFLYSLALCCGFTLYPIILIKGQSPQENTTAAVEAQPSVSPTAPAPTDTSNREDSLDYWGKLVEVWAQVLQIVAIGLGGVWAYYKFVRGRVYRPRLKLAVDAKDVPSNKKSLFFVSLAIENVGLSVVNFQKKSMLLRVLEPETSSPQNKIKKTPLRHLGTFRIFQSHAWIESSESIRDQLLLSIPAPQPEAIVLQFRVVGSIRSVFRTRITEWWECATIETSRCKSSLSKSTENTREFADQTGGDRQ